MNILFVSENYFPYLSGVPVVVQYLAEGLSEKNDVSVATAVPLNDGNPITENVNGVKVHRFKIYRNSAKVLKGNIAGLRQFVIEGQFDVVIIECGQASTTDVLLPVIDRLSVPSILHAHGLSGLLGKPFELKSDFKHTVGASYNWIRMQYYYKHTFKNACNYISASISLTDSDSGYAYLSDHISRNYVLGNAAEDMFFEKENEPYKLPFEGTPYLLSIANYSVVKDQLGMMREFYRTKNDGYALLMIGSKKNAYYYKLLEAKQLLDKQYGKRQVEILTGVDRRCFPYILDHASVYLVSSIYEEFSISIIEAMARAVPFISTNVGNAKLLPGGVIVNDIREMHTAIDNLLNDESKRRDLGAKAKRYAFDNCRRKVAVSKLECIIKEVVSN